jgi:hypothetical protein
MGTVALLLVAMLGGIFFWSDPEPLEPLAIPAAVVQPEAAEDNPNTLMDISFPASTLGADEQSLLIFGEVTVAPGDTVRRYSPCVEDWLYLVHVEEGMMSIDLETEAHILRHGKFDWEAIPAGTAMTVDPGDTLYYRFYTDDFTGISNQGTKELRLLWIAIGGMTPPCDADAETSGMTVLWSQFTLTGHVDPTQPSRLVVRALSEPPGVTFPLEGPDALVIVSDEQRRLGGKQWIAVRAGTLEYGSVPATPVSATPERTIGVNAGSILTEGTMLISGTGKRVMMMSAGDEPIDLAVMNIYVGEPAAIGGIAAP